MGEVNIKIFHFSGIDTLAAGGIGLVWKTHFHPISFGQSAIKFRCGRCTGPYTDPEFLSCPIGILNAFGKRCGHFLGIAGSGKATHTYIDSRRNKRGGLFGGHDSAL